MKCCVIFLAWVLMSGVAAATAITTPGTGEDSGASAVADVAAQAQARYLQAHRAFDEGRLQEALQAAADAVGMDIRDPAATLLLGRIHLALGHADAAASALAAALEQGAPASQIALPLARARNLLGQFGRNITGIRHEDLLADTSGDLWVEQGQALLGVEELSDAAASFDKAIAIDPESSRGLLGLATVHIEQGEWDAADALCKRVLASAPDNADAWYVMGLLHERRGQLAEAEQDYLGAVERNPAHAKAGLARALLVMHRQRPSAAIPLLKGVVQRQPWSLEAIYQLSVALAAAQRDAEARQALQQAADKVAAFTPQDLEGNPRLLLMSSLVLSDLGNLDAAAAYLDQYAGHRPGDVQARKHAAKIAHLLGRRDDALKALHKLAEERPGDAQIRVMLGDLYADAGDFNSAEKHYRDAVDMTVPNVRLIGRLGLAQFSQGRTDLAIATMRRIVDMEQGHTGGASIFLGILYLKVGDLEAARRIADDVVSRQPENLLAINLQAVVAVAEKHYDEGRHLFESVIERRPDYDPARINLIKLDIVEGRYDEAQAALDELLLREPRSPSVLRTRAEMEISRNDYEAASQFLQRILAHAPDAVADALLLSQIYERTGASDRALTLLTDLERRLPEDVAVKQRLAELHITSGDIDTARALLTEAARLAGPHATQRIAVAELQIQAMAYDDAMQGAQSVLREFPDAVAPRLLMARVHSLQRRYNQADDIVNGVLREHPEDVRALTLLADIRIARGQYDDALDLYRHAIAIEDTSDLALSIYRTRLRKGDDAIALVELAAWRESHEPEPRVLATLGAHYARRGELQTAVELYRGAIALDPFNVSALNNLAVAVMGFDVEEALDAANRAYALAPGNAAVLDTLGWIEVQVGNLGAGLARLREALQRNEHVPEIHYHLAVALEESGSRDEAHSALRRALRTDATFAGRADAEQRLRRFENIQ
ncbi:MAG: PEP-CTERM system TPR-repeat protein PrsT [Gammaproteobacteria bacterium]|nr:PEP-CTERM system TPR-repeat protein PrsT [Gammaproteobacteria bacterium]